jgi:hypothetical protein
MGLPTDTDPIETDGSSTNGAAPTSSTGSTSHGTDGTTAGDHEQLCFGDVAAQEPSTVCVPQLDSDLVTACGLDDGACTPGCEVDISLSDVTVSVASDGGLVTRTMTAQAQLTVDIPIDYTADSCTLLATLSGPLTFTQTFTPPADCNDPLASGTAIELSLNGEASGCDGLAGVAELLSSQLVPHIEDFAKSELESELTLSSCTHCADDCESEISCAPQ